MVDNVEKYVIAGGTGNGKSAIITEIGKRGIQIAGEAADVVLREEWTRGNKEPWKDRIFFQKRILDVQLEIERNLRPGITFLDRGIMDGIGFLRFYGFEIPDWLKRAAGGANYAGVFVPNHLDKYERTEKRWEEEQESRGIQREVIRAYREYGCGVWIVPRMSMIWREDLSEEEQVVLSVRNRTDYILKRTSN